MNYVSDAMNWLTQDPVGQKVALGLGVVAAMVALYFVLRSLRWAAARWKPLFGGALVIAGLFYGGMVVFNMGPLAWIGAGAMALIAFCCFALIITQVGGT